FIQVALNHESSSDENREWTVEVDHTTTKCDNSDMVQLVATATAPPSRLRTDYEFFPELGYYKFHKDTVTWPVAREMCAKEGAHLLILNSKVEFEAVKQMWGKYPNISTDWRNDFIHLGLTDHVQEGQFYTLFGTVLFMTLF
ncbi:Hemolymph lipopolysaccharide-binding protein, partial [Blattella germanica]